MFWTILNIENIDIQECCLASGILAVKGEGDIKAVSPPGLNRDTFVEKHTCCQENMKPYGALVKNCLLDPK